MRVLAYLLRKIKNFCSNFNFKKANLTLISRYLWADLIYYFTGIIGIGVLMVIGVIIIEIIRIIGVVGVFEVISFGIINTGFIKGCNFIGIISFTKVINFYFLN